MRPRRRGQARSGAAAGLTPTRGGVIQGLPAGRASSEPDEPALHGASRVGRRARFSIARAEGATYPAARGELETALIPQRPRSAKKPPRGAASLVSDIRLSTLRSTRAPLSMRAADSFEPSSLLLQSEGRSFSGGHEAMVIGMHESRCQSVASFRPTPKRGKHAFEIPAGRRTMSFWPVPKLVPPGKDVCSRRTMSFGPVPKPMRPVSAIAWHFVLEPPEKTGFALQRPRAERRLTSLHARQFPRPPRY